MQMIKYIAVLIIFINCMPIVVYSKSAKIKVHQLSFEGNNAFPDERLERLMLTRNSHFLANSYYYPEVFSDDLDNLIIFYQQNGYLDAKISDYNVNIDSINTSCKIKVFIDEGPLTSVGGIAVFGNNVFGDSILLAKVKLEKNGPFKRNLIQEGQIEILSHYAENGYLDASVKPDIKINTETHTGYVDYVITENPQYSIGNITIEGLNKTKPRVVQRELLFNRGDTIQYSRLLESQKQLYLTGLFQSVFIRPEASRDGIATSKDILIELKENLSGEFNFTVGYGSENRARTRLEINNNNLAGTARKAGIAVQASFLRRAIEASFTEPRLLKTRWRFDINSMFEFVEQPGFDVSRLFSRLTIGRPLSKYTYFNMSFRFEDAKLRHIEVIDTLKNFDPKVRSFTLSISHDSRDNYFDPRRGIFLEWTNEFAGAFLNGNNSFARSKIISKYFYEINNKTIVASAFEIGWIGHLGSFEEIPLSERFYTGGTSSIRGFKYQLVGPLDQNENPIGGKLKVVWNILEIRRALYKLFSGVLFIDAGNVWSKVKDFNISGFRISSGVGLRLGSPIGILRLDYGINIDRRGNEPRSILHFNMGHTF